MSSPIGLTFRYLPGEVGRVINANARREFRISSVTTPAVLLLVALWAIYFADDLWVSIWIGVIGLAFLLWHAVAALIVPRLKVPRYPDVEYQFTFSNDGVLAQTASSETRMTWSHFNGVTALRDFYLLRRPLGYLIIPKRAFQSEADKQAFEALLAAHLPAADRTGTTRSPRREKLIVYSALACLALAATVAGARAIHRWYLKTEASISTTTAMFGQAKEPKLFWAVTGDDAQICEQVSNDEAIAACTRAIESGRFTVRNLASLYINRGYAFEFRDDHDHAISDYDESIKLNPNNALAYNNRGVAYDEKENYDRAIVDFSEAIRINSLTRALNFDINVYLNRGFTHYYMANYDRAASDFANAIKLQPSHPYLPLWLFLARLRSDNQIAAAELESNAKQQKQAAWPYPLVKLFLGRVGAEAALAAASDDLDRCEAQFFVGEWHLIGGDRVAAREMFTTAADICPKESIYPGGVRAELRRLR